jgi:hypothetical protein
MFTSSQGASPNEPATAATGQVVSSKDNCSNPRGVPAWARQELSVTIVLVVKSEYVRRIVASSPPSVAGAGVMPVAAKTLKLGRRSTQNLWANRPRFGGVPDPTYSPLT